ncbi:MAG: hypothetical protein QXN68_05680, partial [Thermoplasmata archaeon]
VSKNLKVREEKDFENWLSWYKDYQKLKGRRKTALMHIKRKQLKYYTTFSFKNEKLENKDIDKLFKTLKKLFERYKISYYLVPEFGDKNGRLHYHGFISVKDKSLLQDKIINNKIVYDKYKNKVLELIPFEKNYGFSTIKDMSLKTDAEKRKMVNYTLKYSLKNGMRAKFDRIKKCDPFNYAISIFGEKLVKKE